MPKRVMFLFAALILLVTACGSDGDSDETETSSEAEATDTESSGDAAAPEPEEEAATEETPAEAGDSGDSSESGGDAAAPPPQGPDATATVTLDNGETYDFSVLCVLEPQMAAGSEILFTAVSYDNPGLDITQFGDEGTVTDKGSISIYDGTSFDILWEASTILASLGGTFELTLDGSTISGGGTFYEAGDLQGATTEGQLIANC